LNKYVTIWSSVAQHPVQTIVSAIKHAGIGLHCTIIHTHRNPFLTSNPATIQFTELISWSSVSDYTLLEDVIWLKSMMLKSVVEQFSLS